MKTHIKYKSSTPTTIFFPLLSVNEQFLLTFYANTKTTTTQNPAQRGEMAFSLFDGAKNVHIKNLVKQPRVGKRQRR